MMAPCTCRSATSAALDKDVVLKQEASSSSEGGEIEAFRSNQIKASASEAKKIRQKSIGARTPFKNSLKKRQTVLAP